MLSISTALDLTTYMHRETEFAPWSAVLVRLHYIYDRLYELHWDTVKKFEVSIALLSAPRHVLVRSPAR